jgi:hypothetical protein
VLRGLGRLQIAVVDRQERHRLRNRDTQKAATLVDHAGTLRDARNVN